MTDQQNQKCALLVSWNWEFIEDLQTQWDMTVIPVLRSLRQEDQKFEDILGYYLVRPHLQKIIEKKLSKIMSY